MAMLRDKLISATLGVESMIMKSTRGCLLNGVISPLLWSLAMDDLIERLKSQGFAVLAYSHDLVIIVRVIESSTVSNRNQEALNVTWNWCLGENLRIN